MKAILTFLQIMFFFSLSYGIVVCGFVIDSISVEPVDFTIVMLRIGNSAIKSDSADIERQIGFKR